MEIKIKPKITLIENNILHHEQIQGYLSSEFGLNEYDEEILTLFNKLISRDLNNQITDGENVKLEKFINERNDSNCFIIDYNLLDTRNGFINGLELIEKLKTTYGLNNFLMLSGELNDKDKMTLTQKGIEFIDKYENWNSKIDTDTANEFSKALIEKVKSIENVQIKKKNIRIGILSVIAVENNALKKVFGITDNDEVLVNTSDIQIYKGHSVFLKKISVKGVEVELCFTCLNKAGNLNSATKTKTFIERCKPDMMILYGIGGGIKTDKSRIGNVFYSRSITSVPKNIKRDNETLQVPRVIDLPDHILNMFNNYEFDINDYHSQIANIFGEEFILNVDDSFVVNDMKPQVDDCSFNSEDSLFKKLIDDISNINPESKLTEMEAAGFVEACTDEDNSHKPWLVIRVVSDFGDGKSDNYQKMVSSFGAVYVKYFIENILRPNSL